MNWPYPGSPVLSSSRMITAPRTMVMTGMPITCQPSNMRAASFCLVYMVYRSIIVCRFMSMMTKSASEPT